MNNNNEKEVSWWERICFIDWDDMYWGTLKFFGVLGALGVLILLWILVIDTWRHYL
jgi:hypothetical protein